MLSKLLWTAFLLGLLVVFAPYAMQGRQERLQPGAGAVHWAFNAGARWPAFLEDLELRELGQK